MDGARRVLRSLRESVSTRLGFAHSRSAFAAPASLYTAPHAPAPEPVRPGAAARPSPHSHARRGLAPRLLGLVTFRGVGVLATLTLFGIVGCAGFTQSGGYAAYVAKEGEPRDVLARAFGFSISAVTISGQAELKETEVLAASGVGPRSSLLFLDAADVRERLIKLPLVKSARVLKLYPDRLVIAIEERQPSALWQRDGHISVISSDGAAVDELRDGRFLELPFLVGEGAQMRLAEYNALLAAAGDLAPRVKAGVFVAGRRWTLDMKNGVAVKLPEQGAGDAIATLARLQRESRILDKDIISIDLRTPGRVAVRLTEESAAARAEKSLRKPVKSGKST